MRFLPRSSDVQHCILPSEQGRALCPWHTLTKSEDMNSHFCTDSCCLLLQCPGPGEMGVSTRQHSLRLHTAPDFGILAHSVGHDLCADDTQISTSNQTSPLSWEQVANCSWMPFPGNPTGNIHIFWGILSHTLDILDLFTSLLSERLFWVRFSLTFLQESLAEMVM